MYHDFSRCSTEGMSCVIGMSDGHRNQAVDATRMQPGDHPRDTGSPIVPDDVCALELNCIQDRDDVLDERGDPVGVDVLWLVRRAEAAQVRRDDAEPGPHQRWDLATPHERRVGKPMEKQNRPAPPLVTHL